MDAINVKNLTKQYGDCIAVNHLSFRVGKGKVLGLLGENGEGKAALLNVFWEQRRWMAEKSGYWV